MMLSRPMLKGATNQPTLVLTRNKDYKAYSNSPCSCFNVHWLRNWYLGTSFVKMTAFWDLIQRLINFLLFKASMLWKNLWVAAEHLEDLSEINCGFGGKAPPHTLHILINSIYPPVHWTRPIPLCSYTSINASLKIVFPDLSPLRPLPPSPTHDHNDISQPPLSLW